jgi:hypothetical protein
MKPLVSGKVEYIFLKTSCEQFYKDLEKFSKDRTNFTKEELFDIVSELEEISKTISFLIEQKQKLSSSKH